MKTLLDLLENIDDKLSYMEDYSHGYEGETITKMRGDIQKALAQFREPSTEQSVGTEQEELKILRDLVVALNKYIDSIGGRDIVYDKSAADEVQRLSEEWFIKCKP